MPSPDDGSLVGVAHVIPRSRDDLERRRRAFELIAGATAGMMGRTPDYLNVTFACFAGRADVWARRGNERGAANIVTYQKQMRDRDLSTTHSIINPQVDRSKPEAEQAAGEVALHKVGETSERNRRARRPHAGDASVRRRADRLPGLATSARRTATTRSRSPSRSRRRGSSSSAATRSRGPSRFDYPLSSRFDEMDAVAIFDDVVVPWERVFLAVTRSATRR